MEPEEPDIMERPPRPLTEGVVTMRSLLINLLQGAIMLAGSLYLFWSAGSGEV